MLFKEKKQRTFSRLSTCFLALSTFFEVSCRSPGGKPEEEAKLQATDATESVDAATGPQGIDPNFCQDAAPGTCFTLALMIPENNFINDMGLSMLSFAAQTDRLKPFVHDACRDGLLEFFEENAKMNFPPRPLRHNFVAKIRKLRCVIYPMRSYEDENFLPPLHPHELAITARLTKFEIEGREQKGQANAILFKRDSTAVLSSYRSPKIAAGKAVPGSSGQWQDMNDLGREPRKVKGSFGSDISLSVDSAVLKQQLAKIDTSKPANEQGKAIVSFFKNAQAAAMSSNPVGGAIVLIGMGYQAYKAVCGEGSSSSKDQQLCSYTKTSVLKTDDISASLPSLLNSDQNETLRMAIVRGVQETLSDVFVHGQQKQIKQVFNIKF